VKADSLNNVAPIIGKSYRMHTFRIKRLEFPENWLIVILFPFKLLTVGVTVGLLVWYLLLPSKQLEVVGMPTTNSDFAFVAFHMGFLYILAACVQAIGGFVQLLFVNSRRAAIWSIAFGVLALIIGILLTVRFSDFMDYLEWIYA